jgi:hypothetical protein
MPQWPILKPLNDWAAYLDMGQICWMSFSAVCAALFMNALTRGLDGRSASFLIICFNELKSAAAPIAIQSLI